VSNRSHSPDQTARPASQTRDPKENTAHHRLPPPREEEMRSALLITPPKKNERPEPFPRSRETRPPKQPTSRADADDLRRSTIVNTYVPPDTEAPAGTTALTLLSRQAPRVTHLPALRAEQEGGGPQNAAVIEERQTQRRVQRDL
jgi:hypothetical protein